MVEPNQTRKTARFWTLDFILGLLAYFFLYLSISLFFILPLFLRQFNPRTSQVGLIMGIHSVTAILIRPFFGRLIDRRGGKRISMAGLIILIITVPFFHLVKDAGYLPVILRAITGLGWGISMTANIAMCTDLAPVESVARSIGIVGVAGLIANAVGPSLGEEIINRWGFPWLVNVAFISLVLSLILVFVTRELPKEEPDEEAAVSGDVNSWKYTTWLILLFIGLMPVVHG